MDYAVLDRLSKALLDRLQNHRKIEQTFVRVFIKQANEYIKNGSLDQLPESFHLLVEYLALCDIFEMVKTMAPEDAAMLGAVHCLCLSIYSGR